MEDRKGRRIIMFPLPFTGHFNPMIELAGIFHHRGFSVTVLHTSYNFPDPSRYPHFTFRTIAHNKEGEKEDPLSHSEILSMDHISLVSQLKQSYAEPFRQSLAAEVDGEETVCCLVSDSMWGMNTAVVAEEMGVRRMVLRAISAASFRAFAVYPLLRDKGYLLPIQDFRLDEPVTELPPLRVKDLPIMKTKDPEVLYRVFNDMVEGAKFSSGVIMNTFEDLERLSLMDCSSKLQVPLFPIGPFHKHSNDLPPKAKNKEDCETTEWLNKKDPHSVVYVSFGSIAAIEEKEFLEIAWGLRNSERSFLWVVRSGSVKGTKWLESLPCGFIENIGHKGKIVKWANQLEVLAHPAIGAFWTHCGWNSTLESICEGVPMICTSWFTDQHTNARYIVDVWRVGMMLERSKLERKEIEKMVRSVMLENGDGLRERCLKLKESANLCLSKDGSSSKYLDKLVNLFLSSDYYAFAKATGERKHTCYWP